MSLAVLGGSFDPVHSGHVAMARHVLDRGLAQKVLVIPAATSPFKSGANASDSARLEMARLAFLPCSDIEVDDREIRRGGSSFMVETLEELHRELPHTLLKLIIGADNVQEFPLWHRSADLLSLAKILVLDRQGQLEKTSEKHSSAFVFVPGFDQRVSSTEIRAILASGRSIGDLIPATVYRYIRDHDLYI